MNLDILFVFISISVVISISIVIAFLAYFAGKKKTVTEKKKLFHNIRLLESQKSGLNREISDLNQKINRYVYFLTKIPEAVMKINSNLSFDSLVPSIIRMVKELIDTNKIEVYIFNKETQSLKLVAAFGTSRKKSITVKFKEGVVGCAAEIGMIFTKKQLIMSKQTTYDEKLEMAIPMRFANRLVGVIGIGRIKMRTLNEERFLAMIADIAAIAFNNCEHMDVTKEEAIKDELTGLYNRRHFFEKAHEAIQKSMNYDFPLSVFIFDIDNFKHYNDTNGHPQGDILLKELSSLLKKNIRSTNIVARYGGEEFIVLLQNTNKKNAMMYAENIRGVVESHPFPHRERQPFGFVSLSGGVAEFSLDGKSIHEVIKHADEALYQSKKSGKNRNTQYETPSLSSSKE